MLCGYIYSWLVKPFIFVGCVILSSFQSIGQLVFESIPVWPRTDRRVHPATKESIVGQYAYRSGFSTTKIGWVVHGKVPLRASRSVVVFSGLRILRITHFIARFTRFFLCFFAFSAVCTVFRDVLPVIVGLSACECFLGGGVGWGGVGGVGGVLGGLITFLFINVPASAFLTRFSLLQVTVWHAFDVLVLICWRWCPVACGHGVGFGGGLERSR